MKQISLRKAREARAKKEKAKNRVSGHMPPRRGQPKGRSQHNALGTRARAEPVLTNKALKEEHAHGGSRPPTRSGRGRTSPGKDIMGGQAGEQRIQQESRERSSSLPSFLEKVYFISLGLLSFVF